MKPTTLYTVFALLLLSISACKQSTDETKGNAILAEVEADSKPIYDPAKGGHIVGSEMTKMLVDTLGIVMYEFIMKPGDSVGWHEHPIHTVYMLEGGTLAVYDKNMERQVFELPADVGFLGLPEGDAAVNIGETTVRFLTHDIYSLNPED